jgi:hypothetical protein
MHALFHQLCETLRFITSRLPEKTSVDSPLIAKVFKRRSRAQGSGTSRRQRKHTEATIGLRQ